MHAANRKRWVFLLSAQRAMEAPLIVTERIAKERIGGIGRRFMKQLYTT
jgi:hypothetical protein